MLKVNTKVRVKSPQEIFKTLDENGCKDNLPFMPEMLQYCGREFIISGKVEKTCVDNPTMYMAEFINNDVYFLSDLRCSGEFHDGCQRACRIFWKEDWLEVINNNFNETSNALIASNDLSGKLKVKKNDEVYFCQSTELRNATKPLSVKEKIQKLFQDYRNRNYSIIRLIKVVVFPLLRKFQKKIKDTEPKGQLTTTPTEVLNLQPGELVEIKSFDEIKQTLDVSGRNKGLLFDSDMIQFCGKRFKVRSRLDKMILERNGKMIEVKNTVILEGVTCQCFFAFGGCPRKEFQFWREVWLKRVE
uniref:Uncharacterized protein n=1 Tax=Ignavibacterium album TaxID=591197 RepID=A0A832D116_9BACT